MPRHQGRLTLDEAAFIEALARVALISTSQPPLSTLYPSDGDRVDFVFQRAGLSNHIDVARRLRNHEFHFGGGFGSSGNSLSPLVLKEAAIISPGVVVGGGVDPFSGSTSTSIASTDPLIGVGADVLRVRDSHSHRFLTPPTPDEERIKRRDIRIAAARADRSTAFIAQAMSLTSPSSSSSLALHDVGLPPPRFNEPTEAFREGGGGGDDSFFPAVRLSPSLARSGGRNIQYPAQESSRHQQHLFSSQPQTQQQQQLSMSVPSSSQEHAISRAGGGGGGGSTSRAYSQSSTTLNSVTGVQSTTSHPIDTAADLITLNFVSTGLSPKRRQARAADAEMVAQAAAAASVGIDLRNSSSSSSYPLPRSLAAPGVTRTPVLGEPFNQNLHNSGHINAQQQHHLHQQLAAPLRDLHVLEASIVQPTKQQQYHPQQPHHHNHHHHHSSQSLISPSKSGKGGSSKNVIVNEAAFEISQEERKLISDLAEIEHRITKKR